MHDEDDDDDCERRCAVCSNTCRNSALSAELYSVVAGVPGLSTRADVLTHCCSPSCLYTACKNVLPRPRTDLLAAVIQRIEQQYGAGSCVLRTGY